MKSLLILAVLAGFWAVSHANPAETSQAASKVSFATAVNEFDSVKTDGDARMVKVDSFLTYMSKKGYTTEDDKNEFKAVFNLMDKTRNGILEQTELFDGLLTFLEFSSFDKDKNLKLTKEELIKTMDADNSGQVNFVEFYARLSTGYLLDSKWKETLGQDLYSRTSTPADSPKAN